MTQAREPVKATGEESALATSPTLQPEEQSDERPEPPEYADGLQHTPTLPLGTIVTDPALAPSAVQHSTDVRAALRGMEIQPANAEEAEKVRQAAEKGEEATIKIAPPAGGPTQSAASSRQLEVAGQAPVAQPRGVPAPSGVMEIAGQAPVPSPQNPDLTAGTEDEFVQEGEEPPEPPAARSGEQEPAR